MTDTIELLESIGKNASLRHAPVEHLARALAGLDASENLRRAAASGDRGILTQELGYRALETPHTVNQTAPEEEEFEPNQNDGDDDELGSGQDGDVTDA